MIYKKSAWYTFVTPVLVGGALAGADAATSTRLARFALQLGLAFQIQDDVLNLAGEESDYGKEIGGDLWEGKHTLILLHAMRTAPPLVRARAHRILAKRRPRSKDVRNRRVDAELRNLVAAQQLTEEGARRLSDVLEPAAAAGEKTDDDVRFLRRLIDGQSSIAYARGAALRRAEHARRLLSGCTRVVPSVHRDFLESLVDYVVERTS
jgi:geranylgeranyl diphosphate synthase type II